MGTYDHKIDRYIASSTESLRLKYIEGGLPTQKIVVKPNFLSAYPRPQYGGDYAIFVGRFGQEKGLHVLVEAWRQIGKLPLKVVGDGPSRGAMEEVAGSNIEFLGVVSTEKLLEIFSGAQFLVFPSIWYEAFPITLLLAYASGKPVVASRLGAMADLVVDGNTGLLFEPGNADDLATKAKLLIDDPGLSQQLGRNARAEFEAKYTPEENYRLLMEIYNSLREDSHN